MEQLADSDIMDWLFLVLALAIYFDATFHRIGKVKDRRGLLNMTAGGWAVWTSMTYIGMIPAALYLAKRTKLIETAREHPVELSFRHRVMVAAFLFVLPMFLSEVATGMLSSMMPVQAQDPAGLLGLSGLQGQ